MPKFDYINHESLVKAGYTYDSMADKYFSSSTPTWDVSEKREAGMRQGAWPSSTIDEFRAQEKEWIERQRAKIKLLKANNATETTNE